jgi:hypothetical protein
MNDLAEAAAGPAERVVGAARVALFPFTGVHDTFAAAAREPLVFS